ncbi:MAG: hypothetical protein Ta2B_05950 [Termitinemataceae bacterium]|nr:MAG: hypothetical protein Ta2B_05950 [Termitinemataceae bacterium]
MTYIKSGKNKNKKKTPMGFLFWVVFLVVIVALFAINLPLIRRTISVTHLGDRLHDFDLGINTDTIPQKPVERDSGGGNVIVAPTGDELPSVSTEEPQGTDEAAPQNQNAANNASAEQTKTDAVVPVTVVPVVENSNKDNVAVVVNEKTDNPKKEPDRERVIYFVKIDGTGLVFVSPVKRKIAYSDSPMLDALNELISGASAGEQKQGLTSLIPGGTRILSARVNGSTATINFNENFMFNNYGAEGYIAQLRQIVWTATEFPNVDDVQILIEGQKVGYISESINIGRPISRNSL